MPFYSIRSFGDQVFMAIFLVLVAGVSSSICYGGGTKRAREAFIAVILLIVMVVQVYHLIGAVNFIPASRFYVYNVSAAQSRAEQRSAEQCRAEQSSVSSVEQSSAEQRSAAQSSVD
jgi:hypothetical protein